MHTREFGAENKSTLFQDFLLLFAVLRVQGRFQNLRQTPVRTKLRNFVKVMFAKVNHVK